MVPLNYIIRAGIINMVWTFLAKYCIVGANDSSIDRKLGRLWLQVKLRCPIQILIPTSLVSCWNEIIGDTNYYTINNHLLNQNTVVVIFDKKDYYLIHFNWTFYQTIGNLFENGNVDFIHKTTIFRVIIK